MGGGRSLWKNMHPWISQNFFLDYVFNVKLQKFIAKTFLCLLFLCSKTVLSNKIAMKSHNNPASRTQFLPFGADLAIFALIYLAFLEETSLSIEAIQKVFIFSWKLRRQAN